MVGTMDKSKGYISGIRDSEDDDYGDEESTEIGDWELPLAFVDKRHTEKIEGTKTQAQTWRMKERVGVLGCLI